MPATGSVGVAAAGSSVAARSRTTAGSAGTQCGISSNARAAHAGVHAGSCTRSIHMGAHAGVHCAGGIVHIRTAGITAAGAAAVAVTGCQ